MPIYEHHKYKQAELPFILNYTEISKKRPEYEWSNMHENVEIIFVTAGEAVVRVDGREIVVREGESVILGMNVLHAVGTYSSAGFYYLIVDRSFCRENYFDTNLLDFELLVRDKRLHDMVKELAEAYSHLNDRKFVKQDIRAKVLSLMAYVCGNYAYEIEEGKSDRSLNFIKDSISYICCNFNRPLTLEEVSRNAGVSKYYFVRVFHEVTGESFVKYLNKVRCDYAKQLLLNSDKPISRICEECGFFAPSYFSRTFKKYVGVLPSEYRANCNSVK